MSRKLLVLIPVSALMLSLLIGGIISGHAQMSQGGFNVKDGVLISYEGTESAVSIPGGVTAIGRQAFENNRFITSVSIPSSVAKIDYAAFAGCTALQSIDIPDSVTKLEDSVFRGCSALSHVGLGKNVYEMGAGVFGDCDSLSAVTIDPGNQYFAMYGGGLYDAGLKKLYQFLSGSAEVVFNAPVSMKEIGKYAFWGADYLEVVAVPAVERISDYAFTNAEGLRFVTIQTPTNEIGVKAFEDCRSLEQIVTPISLKKIHETAFDGVPKSAVFVCEEGSSAYNWATEHGFLQSADAREVAVVTTREAAVPTPIDFAELSPVEAAESINGGGNTGGEGMAAAGRDGVLLGGTTVVSDRAYLDVDGIAVKDGSAETTPVPFNGDIPAYAH